MIKISLKIKWRNWLLKRFQVRLNIPMEGVKVRLTPRFRLLLRGDGRLTEVDRGFDCAIEIKGKHCIIKNFSFFFPIENKEVVR